MASCAGRNWRGHYADPEMGSQVNCYRNTANLIWPRFMVDRQLTAGLKAAS